jgi:23S rRNA (adenine2030-N6)-methyltransferase
VELHKTDVLALKATLERRPGMRALALDGWTALHANIPPKERRGLILIDPPYEATDEFERLATETLRAWRKWPTGIYALWYPIKTLAPPDKLAESLTAGGIDKILRLELTIRPLDDPQRLNGCGLIVLNPPWTLAQEAERLLPALAERLAQSERAGYRCENLSA